MALLRTSEATEDASRGTAWDYTVQIRHDLRLYRNQPGDVHKRGLSWSLMRSCIVNGERFSETIISSPEVFDDPEDAKRDALRKLSILRCPLDLPLDRAVKWILDD